MFNRNLFLICSLCFPLLFCFAQDTSKDKEAIKALIEKQTKTFYARDFDVYQALWVHEPYVVRLGNFGYKTIGWDELGEKYRNYLATHPTLAESIKIVNDKFHIKVYDDVAWALSWQRVGSGPFEEIGYGGNWYTHILEKRNGEWKIAFQVDRPIPILPEISGQELWEKTIAYHDPDNGWDKFKGKVHLISTWKKGNYSEEIIEIDKQKNFYQSRRIDGDIGLVRGFRNGEMFSSIEDETSEEGKRLKKNWLNPESISRMKEWHLCHIGLPMELKNSGMVADKNVGTVELFGDNYYALRFTGQDEKVIHPIYVGTWTLFVNPTTFRIEAIRYQAMNRDLYAKLAGELQINGIKLQQTKMLYQTSDDSHSITDNFTRVQE